MLHPGSPIFRVLGFSRVPVLYQELAMGLESQDYDSPAAKDALPGGNLGLYVKSVSVGT